MSPSLLDNDVRSNVPFFKRVSWGAIFAGAVLVLVLQLMMSLLGLAFGAGSIDPLQEQNPFSGLGLGTAIWLGLTTLLALFAGGWVSARLAGIPVRTESALHGVTTWGIATLCGAYLLTSAAGGVIRTASGMLGQTAHLIGQGVKAATPEIAKAVGANVNGDDLTWNNVKAEADKMLRQTGKSELQPKKLERQANAVGRDARNAAGEAAKAPQSADDELSSLWSRIEARGNRVLEAADKEAFVNVLVARTDMSRAEASQTVDRWQQTLEDAKGKIAQVKEQAEQKTREAGDKAASTVSKAAAWSFVALLLGLIAAGGGGYLGSPQVPSASRGYQRTLTPRESAA